MNKEKSEDTLFEKIQEKLESRILKPYRPSESKIFELSRKISKETQYPFWRIEKLIESLIGRSQVYGLFTLCEYSLGPETIASILETLYEYPHEGCPFCRLWDKENRSCTEDICREEL